MKILAPSTPLMNLTYRKTDAENLQNAGFLLFHERELLVEKAHPRVLDFAELPENIALDRLLYIGEVSGRLHFAAEAPNTDVPAQGIKIRALIDSHQVLYQLAGRALQLLHWNSTHQFCGRCGTPTHLGHTELVRDCPSCGLRVYPRLSPCVIMLVHRGDDILLAQRPGGSELYTIQAGFIEAGESAEAAVSREVMEETGLTLDSLRYFGSQPWPFPDQLMLGYIAENKSGELVPDPTELQNAGWFNCFDLPEYPGPQTISGKLIAHFIAERAANR